MSVAEQRSRIVSSESEQLILVNADDEPVGWASKGEAHDGDGILHRAFSLFIFNAAGKLLLQQRSPEKRLWGGYWSNSCCSHPRAGERMDEAIHRRLEQELGMRADLSFLYKFQYHARFGELGSEHELCWVYLGRSAEAVAANDTEVAAWRYVTITQLEQELADHPERFTPWFKLEWARISGEFGETLAEYVSAS